MLHSVILLKACVILLLLQIPQAQAQAQAEDGPVTVSAESDSNLDGMQADSALQWQVISTRTTWTIPAGWTLGPRADSSSEVSFYLGVKQQNLDQLEAKFWSASNPKSAEYRNFLSIEEINQIVAPRTEHMSAINMWLISNGVEPTKINKFADAFQVHTSVAVTERLFQTELYEFHHSEWKRTVIKHFGSLSLPVHIFPIVDLVLGINNFPHFRGDRFHRKKKNNKNNMYDDVFGVIGQTTYGLYNVPSTQISQNASSITSQGVIEFQEQYFSPEDLQAYSKLVNIPIAPLTKDHIIGKNIPSSQIESTLDIQLISTVNIEAANWFWLEDDSAWLYGFTTHFMNTTDVPQVISISYGYYEGQECSVRPDECQQLGLNDHQYVQRVNVDLQKIGLRGVSVIVASGDSGAHTRTDEDCSAPTLRAEFPSASPFVTSVGATMLTTGTPLSTQPDICTKWGDPCAASGSEVAVSWDVARYSSGGGFSEVAAQPSYQTAAVSAYLNSGVVLPPNTMYNSSNRAAPDVSAVGVDTLIYDSSSFGVMAVGGTSASAPIFASIVSLLNQASIAKSGKPLGFVNPLLYQIWTDRRDAFQDVVVGDNICPEAGCKTPDSCKGWYTAKGWDPVTGLGTPNYSVLLEEVEKL